MNVKTIIIDCDGVLTDGKVIYHSSGNRYKSFHSRDIPAIRRLIKAGYKVYIVSKSTWKGLKHFAQRCGAKYYIGIKDKAKWVKANITEKFIAICDDYDDLEMCKMAHLVFVPQDGSLVLKNELESHEGYDNTVLCSHPGGSGLIEQVESMLIPKRIPA